MSSKCVHHPSLFCLNCLALESPQVENGSVSLHLQLEQATTVAGRERRVTNALFEAVQSLLPCIDWSLDATTLESALNQVDCAHRLYWQARKKGT